MKIRSLLTCSAGALLLASCGKEENAVGVTENAALESSLVVPANDGVDRPLFNDAQKHLRFGGDYYAYTYVGDSYAEIADFVDDFVVVPFLKEPMAEEGMDVDSGRLLDWSGLSGVTAMGSSSHSLGDVYEMRQVVVIDDMSKGIWNFLGEARPALSANVFAPDVSMAMDVQIDLRTMRHWLDELKPMLGEEFSAMMGEAMNQGVGKKTVGEVLDRLDARLALGLVFHADKKVIIPLGEEEKLELPDVDAILCAEGLTENFDELRSMISSQAMFEKVELPDGVTGYAVKAEEVPPLPLENVRPVIAYDEANNRIFVCSRLSYLEETLSSTEKMKDNADYRLAMEGLPGEVISTIYFSKQAGGEIDNLLKGLGENNEQTLEGAIAMALTETENELPGFTSDKALEMMNKLGDWKSRLLGNAWLSISSRDENTIYSVSRMPINARPLTLGGSGMTTVAMMSVLSTIGFSSYSGIIHAAEAMTSKEEATTSADSASFDGGPSASFERGMPLQTEIPIASIVGSPRPMNITNLAPETKAFPKFIVPEDAVLLSKGKRVTSSDDFPIIGELGMITDGGKEAGEGFFVELLDGLQWVQIDLTKSTPLYAIIVWHFHSQRRVYHDVIVQVSNDPEFKKGVTTLFNNDYDNSSKLGKGSDQSYIETNFGLLVNGKATEARYVRLYSKGNSTNELNHYIEVEVWGKGE